MRPAPIEQALVAHLRSQLGVPVSTAVPSSTAARPPRFIVLSRTGGARRNLAQSDSTVLVEAWASDSASAWDLACSAYDALDDVPFQDEPLPFDVWVADVSLTEPVNNPDVQTGTPRYQFIATLVVSLTQEA